MTGLDLKDPLKFIAVGVANTLVGLSTIYLCKWLLGFGDMIANTCGYSLGLALSFTLIADGYLGTPVQYFPLLSGSWEFSYWRTLVIS